MLTIVCFKWRPEDYWSGPSRCEFTAEHVNVLRSMVARNYTDPHRFVCITDDPEGIEGETYPLWEDFRFIENPLHKWVSCYRRLKIFSKEMKEIFGPRILVLDLDCVIVDDMRPVWNRPEPFVGIRLHPVGNSHLRTRGQRLDDSYGGAMYLMDTGAFDYVYEDFRRDTINAPLEAIHHGYLGSDQAWISYKLGPGHPVWTVEDDGVRSARFDALLYRTRARPGCRIVHFHGKPRPWDEKAQRLRWVRENWR